MLIMDYAWSMTPILKKAFPYNLVLNVRSRMIKGLLKSIANQIDPDDVDRRKTMQQTAPPNKRIDREPPPLLHQPVEGKDKITNY